MDKLRLDRRTFALLPALLLPGVARAGDGAGAQVARRCARAAHRFLASLGDEGLARARWPFTRNLRERWNFRAGSQSRRQGVRLGDLSDSQRRLAHELLAAGLSSQGYLKAAGVIRLDDMVRDRADQIVFYDGEGPVEMGQDWYWVTVFGEPAAPPEWGLPAEPWGFRVEGHHLALNFTLEGSAIAVTPAFLGAWPARVEAGPAAGFALLGAEERRAFELLASLDEGQRVRAVVAAEKPRGLFTASPGPARLPDVTGLPASRLDRDQRLMLDDLIGEYVGNVDPALAREWLGAIRADGPDRLHFAWFGPLTPGAPIYYRIQGPSVLIEFDHAADITSRHLTPDPNHVHTIVRRPGRDLGEDLLARHYRDSPHHRSDGSGHLASAGQSA